MHDVADFVIPSLGVCERRSPMSDRGNVTFIREDERLLFQPHMFRGSEVDCSRSFELAGPREAIFFDASEVKAAIVTCGGLCPGLNAVVRGIVMELWYAYGCRSISGIRFGYQGFAEGAEPPVDLTPDIVSGLRQAGGTWLGSSRGTPPAEVIVDGLVEMGVSLFFTVGGDGTMRGAHRIQQEIARRELAISVVGVPKTIDNDIPFVRRSFGFQTAVAEASMAINAAEVEAKGMPNGIGLVKLMGRHAGFIAATATIASGNVNFCLIPEVPFELEGEGGLLSLLELRLKERQHAVVVIAEGAGQYLFDHEALGRDASGNLKLGDIGIYLKEQILAYFARREIKVSMKYIDPSYLIRSRAPTPADQLYADHLARNAVHAAMAGKTGMMVGNWHGELTHVPLWALENQVKKVKEDGELWLNVRANTGQPWHIGPSRTPAEG